MLELLGGLSLVTDLGTGSPLEEVTQALPRRNPPGPHYRLHRRRSQRCALYRAAAAPRLYGDSHEAARVWGDDVITARVSFLSSSGEFKDMWRLWIPGIAKATGRSKARRW